MDLALPPEVAAQLEGFEDQLQALESKLQPFTGPGAAAALAKLDPLERAQAQLAVAGAAQALLRLLLQTYGVDPSDHAQAKKDQERLLRYTRKVRKAAAEAELRESRRSLEVNVSVVNRFIAAAVPDLTAEQKAALKQAGQQAAGGGGGKRKAGGEQGGAAGEAEGAAAAFLEQVSAELQGQQEQQEQAGPGGKKTRQR